MYTQSDEEYYILNHFGDKVGRLLDIGANDGRTLSNTLALIEKGWHGSLVEPSPRAFEKLKKEHADNDNVRLFNLAIADKSGEMTLYESSGLLGDEDVALVSTLNPSEMDRWESLNIKFTPVPVKCLTFTDFCEQHFSVVKWEFISIDVEGVDYQVLSQINLREIGVEMLIVEFNGNEKEKIHAIL